MNDVHEVTNRDRDGTALRLLPMSKDPFQAPTDRDMIPSERRLFVQTHRTCVFGYGRQVARAGHVGRVLHPGRKRRPPGGDHG